MKSSEKDEPKKRVVKKELKKAPSIYEDGDINMHSSMIRTEDEFIKLWTKVSRQNLKEAFKRAAKWREKYS